MGGAKQVGPETPLGFSITLVLTALRAATVGLCDLPAVTFSLLRGAGAANTERVAEIPLKDISEEGLLSIELGREG
eukprot:9496145-Pyramimonas_sp.AAC.1